LAIFAKNILMFKHLAILLLFLSTTTLFAQKITPFQTWSDNDLSIANSAKNSKELSFQEKKVIFYINLARINGSLFAETYLKDYMDDVKISKNKYYKSLVKTLKEQPRLPILTVDEDLFNEAVKHAKEMGKSGRKGHRSGDFESFGERMAPLQKKFKKVKESNQYGFPDALSIVVDLLIDDEQESLRHRKMLLDPDLFYIGVGIRAHKKFMINTSILMGGELTIQ
jgi:uncharacterized protein YkwD